MEFMHKAIRNGDDGDIWRPHESPLIRKLVELFTQRGLLHLLDVQKSILAWESGKNQINNGDMQPKPDLGLMQVWTDEERAMADLYLRSIPLNQWTLDDHFMAVELTVQTYMPKDIVIKEAEWLATKATLMGKVQANWEKELTAPQADKVLMALPNTKNEISGIPLTQIERTTLDFANARAAEHVVNLADNTRKMMRGVILRNEERKQLGGTAPKQALQQELFDNFSALNRDWRRIAVTEAGECQLQGFIASVEPFTKVKRVEMYGSACAFCKKINGVVATVVPANHPNKDPNTMIWPGKNNVGKSASPYKRVGGQLVKRIASELWELPAGLAHPHCRGRWVPTVKAEPGDNQEFAALLEKILA
ncbi:particle associated protein [Yersinia phage fHe-Yen8-01]|nr:particle associated protein [Yersinia phage fHe-Yen8-01]